MIEAYEGGDISLPAGAATTVASCPALESLVGKTLITTDGTTLLGGDDKAGVAIIMELAQTLIENPHLTPRHRYACCSPATKRSAAAPTRSICSKLDATVAYTLDGGGAGVIDVETFSADAAIVRFIGHNIHPAIAKDRMVNALRGACRIRRRPAARYSTPETTDGRAGFIHPYTITGGVGEATVELILRSFETEELAKYADQIRGIADAIASQTPGLLVDVRSAASTATFARGLATTARSD